LQTLDSTKQRNLLERSFPEICGFHVDEYLFYASLVFD